MTGHAHAQAEPGVTVAPLYTLADHVLANRWERPKALDDLSIFLPAPSDADWMARADPDDIVHVECQGIRDTSFLDRIVHHHLGFVLRYWPRRVRTVALWLKVPRPTQRRDTIVKGAVTVQVTSVVVPEIPAEVFLSNPRTACFALAADPGDLSPDDLCRRAVAVLRGAGATRHELHMAFVAAALQGRVESLEKAWDEIDPRPVLLEDPVQVPRELHVWGGRRGGP
jgi:hypothetical protein